MIRRTGLGDIPKLPELDTDLIPEEEDPSKVVIPVTETIEGRMDPNAEQGKNVWPWPPLDWRIQQQIDDVAAPPPPAPSEQ